MKRMIDPVRAIMNLTGWKEMKREILFRGKRADNGEWVYGYLIGNNVIVGEAKLKDCHICEKGKSEYVLR